MQANPSQGAAVLEVSAAALSRRPLGELLRLAFAAAVAIGIRLVGNVAVWRERMRSRAALAGMSERGWKDIGLTRSDVLHETWKPFWRL